jgi:hypothetical protein
MYCNHCGYELPGKVKTCPNCEAPTPRQDVGSIEVPQDIAERARDFVGRSWVVERLLSWAYEEDTRYYILTGEPGSGKTALAAWLAGAGPDPADPADAQRLTLVRSLWDAAHFCVAPNQEGSLSPVTFSKQLAQQLSARLPDYAEGVLVTHDPKYVITQEVRNNLGQVVGVQISSFVVSSSNAQDTYNRLVREPLRFLAKQQPGVWVFILVDGLDEALTIMSPTIVTLLAGSGDLPDGVRFLLISRNEQRVLERFPDAARLNLSDLQHVNDNETDLHAYIDRRLEDIGAPDALGTEILAGAEGNFLYTRFVLDELQAREGEPSMPVTLPRSLFGLYRGYLDRLVQDQGKRWTGEYQPLLGSLSVATPAAPPTLLPGWAALDPGVASARLAEVDQLTEYSAGEISGLRLYHRSMAEYLDTQTFLEEGTPQLNRYHTPAFEQNARIIRHYRKNFKKAWDECDEYGLHRLGAHLRQQLALARKPKQRRKAAKALYKHTFDDGFRRAQIETLGDVQAALDDLRLAVGIALQRDELLTALHLAGIYRQTLRSGRIARGIFEAVEEGNFAGARKRASYYGISPQPRGRWAEVLQLYLAWETGEQARVEEAARLFESIERLPALWSSPMSDALRVRAARSLARHTPERTIQDWLHALATRGDPDALLARYPEARPPDPDARSGLVEQMYEWLDRYQALIEDRPHAQEEIVVADVAGLVQDRLLPLAADPVGQDGIRRMLAMLKTNAYVSYRDIGLAATGVVCLAVPEPQFVRECLRQILEMALDQEPLVFVLDLPAHLEVEAVWRSLPPDTPGLAAIREYLSGARASTDRWGSTLRAQSAAAAALFWHGDDPDKAWDKLQKASDPQEGFMGLLAVGMLNLANRCHEFGDPELADQPEWGGHQYATLRDLAATKAERVRDPRFREERLDLVTEFEKWWTEPALDFWAVLSRLSEMPDPDVRRVFKDLASARWAAPATRDEQSLKRLLPLVLNDGITLDVLLGRLIGPHLTEYDDKDLGEAIRLCADYFLDERPWNLSTAWNWYAVAV